MQHLLNILKLNTFHILYFLVQEISSASTDLIDINAVQCEFFWLNTGMDEDQQNDASDMIN
jgi:intracellular septation protein A